jgi:hypothetical protein
LIEKYLGKDKSKLGYKLLYKATRDGFISAAFHSKVDDKGPCIVVILSEHS